MNSPSPLIPQGSLLEQKNRSRSRVRLAFFCVVGVHLVGLMVLLMQGCKREQGQNPSEEAVSPPIIGDSNLWPVDTNPPPELVETSPPPVTNYTSDPVLPPPVPIGQAGATEYIVARGDSFSTIAKNFPGVTVKAIQDANPNVNPLRLQIGQKLVIPAPTTTPTANGTLPGGTPAIVDGEGLYTVKSGDTLTSIAKKHNTTINALRSANNLSTDRIVVGQKLKLPPKQ